MQQNNGLKRACLYSLVPYRLGFCGPRATEKSRETILDFIKGKRVGLAELKELLKQFTAAYSYYQKIARANRIRDPFDERVVSAYWLGNELLEKFSQKMMPHHSYHVLMVGSVTSRITFTDKLRNLCRISWGRVKFIRSLKDGENVLVVKYKPLLKKGDEFVFGPLAETQVEWDRDFIPEFKIGDTVSIHWEQAVEVLNEDQVRNLEKYTQRVLKLVNSKVSKKKFTKDSP